MLNVHCPYIKELSSNLRGRVLYFCNLQRMTSLMKAWEGLVGSTDGGGDALSSVEFGYKFQGMRITSSDFLGPEWPFGIMDAEKLVIRNREDILERWESQWRFFWSSQTEAYGNLLLEKQPSKIMGKRTSRQWRWWCSCIISVFVWTISVRLFQ